MPQQGVAQSSSHFSVAIDKACQKLYYILSIIQIMLSFARVFPKEIAMKLYEACD